jgi:hypothetical protein
MTASTATEFEYEKLVISLVDQQPSSYVQEYIKEQAAYGVLSEGDKPVICAPSWQKLKSRCQVLVRDETGRPVGLKWIRYIKGCDIIDEMEQDAKGFKPNHLTDVIIVKNGEATFFATPGEVGLIKYLKNYDGNVDNPDRPEGAVDVFTVIDTTIDTTKDIELADEKLKALTYLHSLKVVDGSEVIYDQDAIEFLCRSFALPKFDTPQEAWAALYATLEEDPIKFNKSVASKDNLYKVDVEHAIEKGVIILQNDFAHFSNNKMIMSFKEAGLSHKTKVEKLVSFMRESENRLYYEELRVLLSTAVEQESGIII